MANGLQKAPAERLLEGILWVGAFMAGGYGCFCGWQSVAAHNEMVVQAAQHSSRAAIQHNEGKGATATQDGDIIPSDVLNQLYAGSPMQPDDTGKVIGEFTIPELNIAAPITTGLTKTDLIRGVGHVPGSAMGGGLGNMGLAAHRDTYFRRLKGIHSGMPLYVTQSGDRYEYAVDSTEIVLPEQINVLAIGSVPQLTLITCYPFNYIGAAPRRFIVHAHLVSLVPTPVNDAR
jgi:sortase A